jgi:HTH-type transcriptional regulator, sugar sensing transcriptional regulator
MFITSIAYCHVMVLDDALVPRLIEFGLSEKEAQIYLHLLKYGPKTPSPLSKSLKTYREDVHRTLTSLIEKGMVRPSLDSPTLYAAVDLDTALEAALKKQESELREMEARKRELQELAKQERFRPSDEVATFKILKSIKDVLTAAMPILDSVQGEFLAVVPSAAAAIASLFGVNDASAELIKRGGNVKVAIGISYPMVEAVREMMEAGVEVHHSDQEGITFLVFDRKITMSSINAEINRIALTQPLAVLWTDDPVYAQYLTSTFEMVWLQSIPAEERIEKLLKQGPPKA